MLSTMTARENYCATDDMRTVHCLGRSVCIGRQGLFGSLCGGCAEYRNSIKKESRPADGHVSESYLDSQTNHKVV